MNEEMDDAPTIGRARRGPLLPRADIANQSPEDDDCESRSSHGSGGSKSTSASTTAKGGSRPPLQGNNGGSKRRKHLPVKSSGYGRADPSSSSNNAGRSSSRSSTPILERRGSHSLPASPANSVSSVRSSSRLRHGDGSLPGDIVARDSNSRNAGSNANGLFKKNALLRGGLRSRSPSPAPGMNGRAGRSRTPSPVVKRVRQEGGGGGGSALKKLRGMERRQKQLLGSATKMKQQASTSNQSNGNGLNGDVTHRQEQQQDQTMASPQKMAYEYKDYSQIDADPTPVREARRLSSIFHQRASNNAGGMATLSEGGPVGALELSSPVARGGNGEEMTLSYSKALRKGLDDEKTASSPMSAMKLFDPSDTGNDTNAASLFAGYADPSASQTSQLSSTIFSRTSGIDNDNLNRLLSKKSKGGDVKQWDLRKRLENKEEELGVLRTALKDLMKGKDEFVNGAIGVERGLRSKMVEVQGVFDKLTDEKDDLTAEVRDEKDENARLREQIAELSKERDSYRTKSEVLQSELDGSKSEVGRLQQSNTENAVSMALLQSKLDEAEERKAAAMEDLRRVKEENADAVKVAEEKVAVELLEDIAKLQGENDMLKGQVEAGKANEEGVRRLLDIESANDGDGTANSFLDAVQERFDGFRKDLAAKEGVEKSLEGCLAELEKAKADHQTAFAELARERDSFRTRSEVLRSELDGSKAEAGRLQQSNTDNAVSMALMQSKLDEAEAQEAAAMDDLRRVEAENEEAVKVAEEKVAVELLEDISKLQKENGMLKSDVEARMANEDGVRRMLEIESANDGDGAANFLEMVEERLDGFRKDLAAKEGVKKSLESCTAELEKVKADHKAALETVATKAKDMSELMKSIGDIQRAAEDRAATAEAQAAERREEMLSLGFEKKALEEQLEASNAACADRDGTIASLRKEIADSKIENVQHDSQLQLERDLRSKAEEKEAEERAERIALAAQLNAQLQEHAASEKRLRESMESMERSLKEQVRLKEEELRARQAEVDKCRETITSLEAHQASLKQSLSEQKSMLDASKEEEIGRLKGEIANLESRLRSEVERLQSEGVVSEARLRELEEIIRKGEVERKRMHNIIQELRGNVRVFARIRPFIPDDGKQGEEGATPFVSHEGDTLVTVPKPNDPSEKHRFSFDRVFAPSAGQETVFEEVSEFVQSALDGYNVCLFSYGQTGSGKTFTMQGLKGVMRGLIPRSIKKIGEHKQQMEKEGWSFHVEVSFLEIYNETLRDLLRENMKEEKKLDIKVGSDGRRSVTNLTVQGIDPNDHDSVESVLALAAKRRSTASTDMNATSSRSHSVFTLNMTAKHEEQNKMVRGTLNLVDLAGSERLDRSRAEGRHAKEAMAINKSLSSLADVFTAIAAKSSHVPFRNSRLTWLLAPALSGDGKTCMLVSISPTEDSVQESLCSLRFASKVNKCELGKAKRTIGEAKSGAPKRGKSTISNGSATSRNVKRKL